MSKDDLRTKLQSRQHKPLNEYKGPANVMKKVRPDGTEYIVGVPLPKPTVDLSTTMKGKGRASDKENALSVEWTQEENEEVAISMQMAAEGAFREAGRIPAVCNTLPAPGADDSAEIDVYVRDHLLSVAHFSCHPLKFESHREV